MTQAPGANDVNPSVPSTIRAAEYVRMSTDHQRYSTENQADAIREYAKRRGIEIVRTYADHGKSGLSIAGRDALKRLLDDVRSGRADFTTILVYDISRWGRFQDADESAYHEYVCKRAGVTVEYCAEQFENNGSVGSDILKSVKRVMAREYSRDLGNKTFIGQCRLIELGFRQGGAPGFGLRRELLDEAGASKGVLTRGQQKSIHTDRVVLVPGPSDEVETVRWIYRTFVEDARPEREIAAMLNARNLRTDLDRPWTRGTVHQVLINEKYVGDNVWNRISCKLHGKRVRNGRDMWVRRDAAFEAVVDRLLFDAAQVIIQERSRRLSNDEMLDVLRRALAHHGYLSGLVIDETDDAPSSSAYQLRFGSLISAYQMIGFTPDRDYRYIEVNRLLRAMHPSVVATVLEGIRAAGGSVEQDPKTELLTVNHEFTTSVVLARCQETASGGRRWHVRFDTGIAPDITVAVRMAPGNSEALDYYLLPRLDMNLPRLRLRESNGISLDAYRFDRLDALFDLAARTHILEVA